LNSNNIAVVGSGPAGISAAIQLKRYGLSPDLYEGNRVGGLLWNANLVENYPGFPEGISGPELIGLMERQLKKFSVDIRNLKILKITLVDGRFALHTEQEINNYDYVIVATGTKPMDVKKIQELAPSTHVHHDISDILHENGKKIVIVGNGDAAFDQAINLARSNEVLLVNRSKYIKCLALLSDIAFKTPTIKYLDNTEIKKFKLIEGNGVNACYLKVDLKTDMGFSSIDCDELVFAIGRKPNLDFLHVEIDTGRLFFAGDVHNGRYRQTSIAVGEGVMAAMKIYDLIITGDK